VTSNIFPAAIVVAAKEVARESAPPPGDTLVSVAVDPAHIVEGFAEIVGTEGRGLTVRLVVTILSQPVEFAPTSVSR
jgi:hypothetical protein